MQRGSKSPLGLLEPFDFNMNNRIKNLQKFLKQNDLPAFFVTSEINRKYLSGFSGSRGDLAVFAGKTNAVLFTDSRYGERAREEAFDGVEVAVIDKNYSAELKNFLSRLGVKKMGIEADSLSLRQYENLKKNLRGVKLIKTEDVIKNIRAVKDEEEIKKLKKAIALTDETFSYIFKFIKKNYQRGITEKRIAWEMEKFIRENKGADLSFASIVACGKNSAIPHHLSGQSKIKKGDMVLLDFGAMFKGYHADMSRTIFIGTPSAKQKEVYKRVLKAQKDIIKIIRPGIVCGDLDKRAREIFEQFGCRDNFLHGLGHGVGLEIHELPSMRQARADNRRSPLRETAAGQKLKPNMIFTVEPGIYYSGFGGVRIEDIVLVTAKGKQVLSRAPKDLGEMII